MTKTTALRAGTLGGVVLLCLGAGYLWGSHTSNGGRAATSLVAPAAAIGSATAGSGTQGGITVTGDGTVSGTPDTLKLAMGVEVTGSTVTAALDAANGKAAAVQKSLRDHGVDAKDLQTSGLSIQPNYTESGGRSVITGYRVGESLTATLRDLKTAGDAVSAAAVAGGDSTRIDAVSLDLSDTGPLVTAARERAFAQAKSKAEQYAHAAGVDLGAVLSISEAVTNTSPVPYAMPMAAAGAKVADVPVAAGSQQVGVDVTVVFGIG